jgi:hypothetical protein
MRRKYAYYQRLSCATGAAALLDRLCRCCCSLLQGCHRLLLLLLLLLQAPQLQTAAVA